MSGITHIDGREYARTLKLQPTTEHCVSCEKPTPKPELEENKKTSTSGFNPICDDCYDENQSYIDGQIDGRE